MLEKSINLELNCSDLNEDQLAAMFTKCSMIKHELISLYTAFVYSLPSSCVLSDICFGVSNILGLIGSDLYIILEGGWVSTKDINGNGDLDFIILDDRSIDFSSLIEAIKIKTKQGKVFPLERYLETSIIFWKTIK